MTGTWLENTPGLSVICLDVSLEEDPVIALDRHTLAYREELVEAPALPTAQSGIRRHFVSV